MFPSVFFPLFKTIRESLTSSLLDLAVAIHLDTSQDDPIYSGPGWARSLFSAIIDLADMIVLLFFALFPFLLCSTGLR